MGPRPRRRLRSPGRLGGLEIREDRLSEKVRLVSFALLTGLGVNNSMVFLFASLALQSYLRFEAQSEEVGSSRPRGGH